MKALARVAAMVRELFGSASGLNPRPQLDARRQSNVPGLYVIGDLAGAPVIKLAMEQGVDVIDVIAKDLGPSSSDPSLLDVLVVGAGAAGLNAALAAQERGLRVLVLEKERIANTIENFPEGKWVYAEPDATPPKGKLWLDGTQKEELVARWHQIVRENRLDVRTEEPLRKLQRARDGSFTATTPKGTYRARRVVLATGQRGNPRKLGVPGEEREEVYHRLYSPRKYEGERILVVGGGNSAVEAALTLSERNAVTLCYRGDAFARLFKDNERRLAEAVRAGRVTTLLESNVRAFGTKEATLVRKRDGREETLALPYDHAFVLIGADVPVDFLRSLGIRMENDWTGSLPRAALLALATLAGLWIFGGHATLPAPIPGWLGGLVALAGASALVATAARGDRFSWLASAFLAAYTIYGVKVGEGEEFWPFRDWGYQALSFLERPWSFWYNVVYAVVMTVFGLQALKRWGLDKRDSFQVWRYVSLISVQWIIAVIIPEILFQWAVKYQWVGAQLANNPQFRDQAWRAYGIVYAWPLFFYTFFYDPHWIWVVWGIVLTFVILPVFAIWQGKRYCSWICGCGGLAETLGDRWRHLAPKGKTSIRWEQMNLVVLAAAFVITGIYLARDVVPALRPAGEGGIRFYRILVDVWLVGIVPVTLYPFLGGKIWCRYWCPLAKLMQFFSNVHAKLGIGRFGIEANDKCIACYECTRNCQVGIDVMSYALKQERLDNLDSSCIGCGVCVTVCPMDTLTFSTGPRATPPAAAAPVTFRRPS